MNWTLGIALMLAATECPGQSNIAIPFHITSDNRIHVDIAVNGRSGLDFIFDTGADTCVLTERGRAKLPSLKFKFRDETLGLGGRTMQPVEKGVTISGNRFQSKKLALMFIDYHGSLEADGVLGYNVFADRVVTIDHDKRLLLISDHEPPEVNGKTPMMVTMQYGLPFVHTEFVTDQGHQSALFAVDTGFSGSMSATNEAAVATGLPGTLTILGTGKIAGTGNTVIPTCVLELPSLKLGDLFLKRVPMDVQLATSGTDKRWSLMGNELLKRANLTWNIPNRRMFFIPNHLVNQRFAVPASPTKKYLLVAVIVLSVAVGLVILRRMAWTKKQ